MRGWLKGVAAAMHHVRDRYCGLRLCSCSAGSGRSPDWYWHHFPSTAAAPIDGVAGHPWYAPRALRVDLLLQGHLSIQLVDLVDDVAQHASGSVHTLAQPGSGDVSVALGAGFVERVNDGPADVNLIIPVDFVLFVIFFLLIFIVVAPGDIEQKH